MSKRQVRRCILQFGLKAKVWVIPAERSKNGKPNVVPLSAFAIAVLADVPRFLNSNFVLIVSEPRPRSGRADRECVWR